MLNSVDIERAMEEKLPQIHEKLLKNKQYGAFRYATYIDNYSSYDTYIQFVENATEDELYDMECMYVMDWETRKHSKSFKMFIPPTIELSEEKWKKILKHDISQFYEVFDL